MVWLRMFAAAAADLLLLFLSVQEAKMIEGKSKGWGRQLHTSASAAAAALAAAPAAAASAAFVASAETAAAAAAAAAATAASSSAASKRLREKQQWGLLLVFKLFKAVYTP